MTESMMKIGEVLDETGQGKSKLYDDIKNGTFPEPFLLGQRAVAWKRSEVDSWIAERPRVKLAKTKSWTERRSQEKPAASKE